MKLTFEQLPQAVSKLFEELNDIKTLLAETKTNQGDSKKLLTIQEASKYINLAVPTIYGLVGKKEIPFMKVAGGRRLYFLEEELAEWIKAGRQKTTAEIAALTHSSVTVRRRE